MTSSSSLYGSTPQSGNVSSSNFTTLYSGGAGPAPTGNLVVPGTLTVNGCAILTNCSSFSLLPTTAESILFGGASTAMTIGSGTGVTTINNQLATANYTFPVADGLNGQVLVTDGSGTLSFTTAASVGKTYDISASSTTGGANLDLNSNLPSTDSVKFASGTGITVSRTDANTITITNTDPGSAGVTSITGTANQINVSSPTGAVTLSTPQDIATTSNPTFAGATLGNVKVGIFDNNTITNDSANLTIGDYTNTTYWPVINSAASVPVAVQRFTTGTSGVVRSLALNVQSSGTPTVGFGNSLEFQLEAQPGNTERAGAVAVTSTDLTVGSEDFKMSFILMENGATATEKAYLTSDGNLYTDGFVNATSFAAGGVTAYDGSGPFTTSTTTPNQVASTTSASAYRSLKYFYQITSGTEYQAVEIMIIHDGTTAYLNTYSDVRTGSNLSTFSADISGGNIRLLVTPTNAVTTYKGSVIAIEV